MFDKNGMKQVVSAAVVAALSDKAPQLLTDLVDKVLSREVNQHGGKPEYRDEKMTLLEQVARSQLEKIVVEATVEWMSNRKDEIRESVNKKLADGGIADSMVDALLKTVTDYGFRVNLSVER